jgi:diaminohydroxyphosphoribosylaminopyrimidine deaminase/5-amino-6-(5-phosphoribosylamino)uracil reductase
MTQEFNHEYYMQRCIELAKNGAGLVAPNPMVGAVIVHKNRIIGQGYHAGFGEPHAEVHAIDSVKDKALLPESTLYVSLEPCAHQGKTPPCADLIASKRIPKVVIGMVDPFNKVNGAGIKRLEQAGCEVTTGILEKECWDLNKAFITYHTQKRPYIILKWAQTLDGFIDKKREPGFIQEPNWITNEVCRSLVHKWRSEVQSIMVGTHTAFIDNPQLNVRVWSGKTPLRIVLDKNLKLDKELHLFDQQQATLVLNSVKDAVDGLIEYKTLSFGDALLRELMKMLYDKGVNSLLVEGGQQLLQSFINKNYWDEARVFTGNVFFKQGTAAPVIKGVVASHQKLRDNFLITYLNR